MNNSVPPKSIAPPPRRSLKDEFAFGPFTDDEKARLSDLVEKGGIVAHIIRTYVTDTSEYKTGFRRGEKISGFRNATSFFDQRAPATILKYLSNPDHRRYHRCWEELYRAATNLFLQAELPNLWRMLGEVAAPQDTERTELLRTLCVNAFSFNVTPADVERFYEVWPGPRTTELPSLLPLCLRRDEASIQRLTVARLEREVAELQQRIAEAPAAMGTLSAAARSDDSSNEELSARIEEFRDQLVARLEQLDASIKAVAGRAEQVAQQADNRIVGLASEVHEQAKQVSERLREQAANTQRTVSAQFDKRSEGLAQQIEALGAVVHELGLRLSKAETRAQASESRVDLVSCLPPARPTVITDQTQLKEALRANFKACEVAPSCAKRLHAALAAQLFVIVSGTTAFSALAAYSRAACGGRMATLSVAPNTTDLNDLLSRRVAFFGSRPSVSDFLSQVRNVAGPVLLVLEGANRAPTESYLLPLLLFRRLGLSPEGLAHHTPPTDLTPPSWPRNLWVAATAVEGPTTLPLSRELLTHSVIVEAAPYLAQPSPAPSPSETSLEGELCAPLLDLPDRFEDLADAFEEVGAAIPTVRRFARHYARFETSPAERLLAVVEAIVAPLAASLEGDEERQAAVKALQMFVGPQTESLTGLTRRLRRLVA